MAIRGMKPVELGPQAPPAAQKPNIARREAVSRWERPRTEKLIKPFVM